MLTRLLNSATRSTMLRMYCKRPEKLNAEKIQAYNEAITIRNDDPNITKEDLINKGFAFLTFKEDFKWNARQCFELAKKSDPHNFYKDIIECGLEQVANNQPDCYHAVIINAQVSSFKEVSKIIEQKNTIKTELPSDSPGASFKKTLKEAGQARKKYSPYSG